MLQNSPIARESGILTTRQKPRRTRTSSAETPTCSVAFKNAFREIFGYAFFFSPKARCRSCRCRKYVARLPTRPPRSVSLGIFTACCGKSPCLLHLLSNATHNLSNSAPYADQTNDPVVVQLTRVSSSYPHMYNRRLVHQARPSCCWSVSHSTLDFPAQVVMKHQQRARPFQHGRMCHIQSTLFHGSKASRDACRD